MLEETAVNTINGYFWSPEKLYSMSYKQLISSQKGTQDKKIHWEKKKAVYLEAMGIFEDLSDILNMASEKLGSALNCIEVNYKTGTKPQVQIDIENLYNIINKYVEKFDKYIIPFAYDTISRIDRIIGAIDNLLTRYPYAIEAARVREANN